MQALLIRFLPHIIAGLAIAVCVWIVVGWKADSEKLEICRADLTIAAGEMAAMAQRGETNRRLANEYYDQQEFIDRQLADAKRMQPQRCICPITQPALPGACMPGASAEGEFYQADGITSDALYDFAGDAERVRQQLLACQAWVRGQE